jgi:hypothetical protein
LSLNNLGLATTVALSQPCRLSGRKRATEQIAEIDHAAYALRRDIGQDGRQGISIAVNVGNGGEAVEGKIIHGHEHRSVFPASAMRKAVWCGPARLFHARRPQNEQVHRFSRLGPDRAARLSAWTARFVKVRRRDP